MPSARGTRRQPRRIEGNEQGEEGGFVEFKIFYALSLGAEREFAVVHQGGDAGAGGGDLRQIERGGDDAGFVSAFGEDVAPRADNQAVAVGFSAAGVGAALRGGDYETAGFNGSGTEQHMPVRGAGDGGESGGHGEDVRT